jgi:hypothetical protein
MMLKPPSMSAGAFTYGISRISAKARNSHFPDMICVNGTMAKPAIGASIEHCWEFR